MKYFLPIILLVFELFTPTFTYADSPASVANPTYYCIGTNFNNPNCQTHSFSNNAVSNPNGSSPAISASPNQNNNPSASNSQSGNGNATNPCSVTTSSVGPASTVKIHAAGPPGLLQNITQTVIQSFVPQYSSQTAGTTTSQSALTYASPCGLQIVSPANNNNTVSSKGGWSLNVQWNPVSSSTNGTLTPSEYPTSYTIELENSNNQPITGGGATTVNCSTTSQSICTYKFSIQLTAPAGTKPAVPAKLPSYTVLVKTNSNNSIAASQNASLPVTPGVNINSTTAYVAPSGLQVVPGKDTVGGGQWNLTVEWNIVTKTSPTINGTVPPPTSYTASLIMDNNGTPTTLKTNAKSLCTTNTCTSSFSVPVAATAPANQPNTTNPTTPIYTVAVKANSNSTIGESPYASTVVSLGTSSTLWGYEKANNLKITKNSIASSNQTLAFTWSPPIVTTTGISVPSTNPKIDIPTSYKVEIDYNCSAAGCLYDTNNSAKSPYSTTIKSINSSLEETIKITANSTNPSQTLTYTLTPGQGASNQALKYSAPKSITVKSLSMTTVTTNKKYTWGVQVDWPAVKTYTTSSKSFTAPQNYTVEFANAGTNNIPEDVIVSGTEYKNSITITNPKTNVKVSVWANANTAAAVAASDATSTSINPESALPYWPCKIPVIGQWLCTAPKSKQPKPKGVSCSVAAGITTPSATGTCKTYTATSNGGFVKDTTCSKLGANYQCFITATCSTPSGSGHCYMTSDKSHGKGTFVRNYCPGPTNIQCFVSSSSKTGSPNPNPGGANPPAPVTGNDSGCKSYATGAKCVQTNGKAAPSGYYYVHNLCLSNNSPTYLCEVPNNTSTTGGGPGAACGAGGVCTTLADCQKLAQANGLGPNACTQIYGTCNTKLGLVCVTQRNSCTDANGTCRSSKTVSHYVYNQKASSGCPKSSPYCQVPAF